MAVPFADAGWKEQLPEHWYPALGEILRDSLDHSWRMVEESLRVEEARGEEEAFASGEPQQAMARFFAERSAKRAGG
jgi:hypothetical protein